MNTYAFSEFYEFFLVNYQSWEWSCRPQTCYRCQRWEWYWEFSNLQLVLEVRMVFLTTLELQTCFSLLCLMWLLRPFLHYLGDIPFIHNTFIRKTSSVSQPRLSPSLVLLVQSFFIGFVLLISLSLVFSCFHKMLSLSLQTSLVFLSLSFCINPNGKILQSNFVHAFCLQFCS